MSELRLFSISGGKVKECHPASYKLERELQDIFEANLEELLGVRYVASEFSTGQGGRIDTLGIDENGFPVVIEYKLDKNRTVINQGISYVDWLTNNIWNFYRVVREKLGQKVADSIDHSSIRLICVAAHFTPKDLSFCRHIKSRFDLFRYRRFGDDQLLLERITSSGTASAPSPVATSAKTGTDKPISQRLEEAKPEIKSLYESLRQAILDQGEDVSEKATKLSFAFKRTRNFASIVLRKNILLLYLDLNPDSVEMKQNMRDVRNIGHWGTGDLEVRIGTLEDIQQALPLIQKAYEGQA